MKHDVGRHARTCSGLCIRTHNLHTQVCILQATDVQVDRVKQKFSFLFILLIYAKLKINVVNNLLHSNPDWALETSVSVSNQLI